MGVGAIARYAILVAGPTSLFGNPSFSLPEYPREKDPIRLIGQGLGEFSFDWHVNCNSLP
jgi:hypothetical protein